MMFHWYRKLLALFTCGLLAFAALGLTVAIAEPLEVRNVDLASEHLNISDCLEASYDLDRSNRKIINERIYFRCEGEAAQQLYYDVALHLRSDLLNQGTAPGITPVDPRRSVLVKTPHGQAHCWSLVEDVVNGIVQRQFACEVEALTSPDSIVVSGFLINSAKWDEGIDRQHALESEFDGKHAVVVVDKDQAGELSAIDAPSPLCWIDQSLAQRVRYRCATFSSGNDYLVYQPGI